MSRAVDRMMDMCEHHRLLFAWVAADHLDGQVPLAAAFDRYHERCLTRTECDR